jgi:uncharacterized protein (DUF1501 family)
LPEHEGSIAELIAAGADTSVCYASIAGFDTYADQLGQQERALGVVSDTLEAFVADLRSAGRWDDVMILVFSEFGRRVAQNASNGTDHGKANNVFIISSKMSKAGIYNASPNLGEAGRW